MYLSVESLAILFLISICSGILNSISGGGGMILIPSMIYFGIPPINAIAINKFQNTIGSIAAIKHYIKHGFASIKNFKHTAMLITFGSIFGAFILQSLSESGILTTLIPYILICTALYSVIPQSLMSKLDFYNIHESIKKFLLTLIAIYGGSISLGTGPILIGVHRAINRLDIKYSIAQTKPIMLIINITSLIVLVAYGHLLWQVGLIFSIGNYFGSTIGSRIVTGRLFVLVKLIVFIVPFMLALKLLGLLPL